MPIESPTLIAAGPWHDAEFARVRAELDADQRWQTAPTLHDAIAQVAASSDPPELVLLAQSHPGADDQASVERLRQTAPLTRVIVVAGSWCEGEFRTGRPPAGTVRIYWYEFAAWWRAAMERRARGETPPWAEPLNDLRAGHSIRLSLAHGDSTLDSGGQRRLAIDSTDLAVFEVLSAGLGPLGWDCVWQPRHRREFPDAVGVNGQTPAAGLWDGGQLDTQELADLTEFCGSLSAAGAPVIALLDFPRAEHVQQVRAAGAAGMLAKPYQLALLHHELCRAMVTTRPPVLCE